MARGHFFRSASNAVGGAVKVDIGGRRRWPWHSRHPPGSAFSIPRQPHPTMVPTMSVVINGAPVEIPGLTTVSWLEEPRLRLRQGEDFTSRKSPWIQMVVLHTTKGLPFGPKDPPQQILPGFGPAANAGERCANYWSHDGRNAGAHLVVDHDGTIACCV